MPASCHGRRPKAAARDRRQRAAAVFLPLPALLAGCSDGIADAAAWGVVLLGALSAVAAAYLLGATRSRVAGQMALRAARAEALQQAQLQEGTPWQTDTLHQLISWCGSTETAAAQRMFADPAVRAQLQARRGFTEQRVVLGLAFESSGSWLLRGVPRHDDLGLFCGFTGIARPLQATDEQQTRAAALHTLLTLHQGPALLALDTGNGWEVQQCNDAARAVWPQLTPGQALPAALGLLPQAVALAFADTRLTHPPSPSPSLSSASASASASASPAAVDIDGWQLQPCEGLPAGWRGLVVVQRALPAIASHGAAAPAAAEAAAGVAAEAESENASFSFTLSHDLRAPIRVVEGFTRIVKEDYGRLLDRVGNDHLDRVLSAAARMNLMIDALLTLARLSSQPLARQPVNLSQLAAFVVDDLRRTAPEREVEVEIEPGLSTQGDPTLLRLVLENLLGNAWKYTGRTAQARLYLGVMSNGVQNGGPNAGPSAAPGAASGASPTYVMRDNGAGFDMRSSERLFGLFQRLHSASEFPGHGVGLASVRRIVRRHGGDIWAEAEPGRGAAFYFTLAA